MKITALASSFLYGYALLPLLRKSDDLLDPVRCDVNREAVDRLLQTR
jgi:hypothetical protein